MLADGTRAGTGESGVELFVTGRMADTIVYAVAG
jgi:hypothetical protein